MFYTSAVTTLRLINADPSTASPASSSPLVKHPLSMPPGKAARFRITSALCAEVKAKGYTGELGYEAFLYPNEAEMRRVLRFLVDRLPRHDDAEDEAQQGKGGVDIHSKVSSALLAFTSQTAQAASRPLHHLPFRTVLLELPNASATEPALSYCRQHQPLLPLQPLVSSSFIPSLLQYNLLALTQAAEKEKLWNSAADSQTAEQRRQQLVSTIRSAFSSAVAEAAAAEVSVSRKPLHEYRLMTGSDDGAGGGGGAFKRRVEFEQEKDVAQARVVSEVGTVTSVNAAGQSAEEREAAEEETRKQREAELNELNAQLQESGAQTAQLEQRIASLSSSSQLLEAELASLVASTPQLEEAYKVKKRTLDLLPDAQRNQTELRALVEGSSQRLVDIAAEWEHHRQSLIARLRRQQQLMAERREQAVVKAESIKRLRDEQKQVTEELRQREQQLAALTAEYEALPKSTTRSVYVRRILDIMRAVDKQKQEIGRVLDDVRRLQKDINLMAEASKRAFAMADEIVFSSAKQQQAGHADPAGAKAYRSIVELREAFGSLVGVVSGIGRLQSEMRELTTSLDDLQSRNTALNMERLDTDLQQIRKENKQLQAKLKQKT